MKQTQSTLKRVLSVFVSIAMVMSMVPTTAIAEMRSEGSPAGEEQEVTSSDFGESAAEEQGLESSTDPADDPSEEQASEPVADAEQNQEEQETEAEPNAPPATDQTTTNENNTSDDQQDSNEDAEETKKDEEEAAKKAEEEAKAAEEAAKHPLATAPEGIDPSLADGVDFSSLRLLVEGIKAEDFTPDTQVLGEYEGLFLTQYATQDEARNAYLYYKHVKAATLVEPDVAVSVAEDEVNEAPAQSVAAKPMDEQSNPLAELADATADGEVAEAAKASERTYTIALVDTGYEGEGLVAATSVLGDATADDNGHGTRMAGYIRELDKDARILSIKALDATGTGTTASVYAAIKYAVEAKANVIDLSLSAWATEENVVVREAIDEATKAGVIVVGAAGNKGVDAKRTIPGGVESALVTGAANADGTRVEKSNYGETVDAYVTAGSTSEAAARMSGWLSAGEVGSDWEEKLAAAIRAGTFSNGSAYEVAGPEQPAEPEPNEEDSNFHAADYPVDYSVIPEGRYAIRNNYSSAGLALSAESTSYSSGLNVCLRNYASGNGHLEQRWTLRQYPYGSGYGTGDMQGQDRYYTIHLAGQAYHLDTWGNLGDISQHANVMIYSDNSGDHVVNSEAWYIWTSGITAKMSGTMDGKGYRIYQAGKWAGNGWTGYALNQINNLNVSGTNVDVVKNKDTDFDEGLYWTFTKCNYKVQFRKNDSAAEGGTEKDQTIQLDSTTKLAANPFTKTGYTFKGWTKTKNGTTVVRTNQANANAGTWHNDNLGVEGGTVTLYPVWEKANYYLDLNGYLDGTRINNISGYGKADVTVNNVVQKTGVDDYYAAHPYQSSFTVVVTANEGRTVSGATVENAASSNVSPTAATASAASKVTITGTIGASQVNVNPQFTKNKYKVKFDGNSASEGTMNEQEFVYDTAANLTQNSFKRTGYTFKGWSKSKTATTPTYTDKQSVSKLASKYKNNESVTLYAVWQANDYTMTLDAKNNSGENDGHTKVYVRYNTGIYRSWQSGAPAEVMTASANAITKPSRNWKVSYQSATNDGQTMQLSTTTANTQTNATFNGYYSAETGGTQYINANGFVNTNNFKNNTFTANQTFYAQWGAGGTVTLPTPTMNHYTFDGWYKGVGGTGEKVGDAGETYQPSGDITLYAKWNKTYFNVRFDANGGSGTFARSMAWHEEAAINGASAPSRSGYVFQGYFDAKTGGNKVYNADLTYALTNPTTFHGEAATTYYAHWSPAQYYVQFMGWDDDLQDDVVVEVLGDDGNPTPAVGDDVPAGCQAQTFGSYTLPGAEELGLSRKHYTFVGWNIYPSQDWRMYEANKAYKGGLAQKQNDVVILYAAWEPMDQYTISYDSNGGSGKPATEEAYKGEDYEIPDAPGLKNTNKKFLGWNTSVDGTGNWYYHGDGPKTIERGEGTTEANFGYFTTASGEDPGYVSDGTTTITIQNKISGDDVTHNTVLYAIWADWPKLSYNMNDGIGYIAPEYHEPFSNAELDFIATHVPTRTGYDFVGWAERTGGEGTTENPYTYGDAYTESGVSSIPSIASDVTLYAQWEKQHIDVDAATTVDDVYVYLWNPGDEAVDGTRGNKIEDATWVPYGDPYWFAVGVTKYYDGSNMTVAVNGTTLRSQGIKVVADDPETQDVDEACTYYLYKVNTPVEPQSIDASGIDELTYRVVLMPQGGTVDEDHNVTSYRYAREGNNLPTEEYVTRPGYVFAGWFTNEECTEPESALTAVPVETEGDVAYYAKWEPLSFKVRYHSNAAHTFGAEIGVSDNKQTYVPNDEFSYTEAKRLESVQSLDMFGETTTIGTGSGNFVGWATSEEDRDNSVVTFTNQQRISGIVPSKAKAAYKYDVEKIEDEGAVTYELTTNDEWPGDENAGYTITDVTDRNSEYYFTTEGATVTLDGEAAAAGVMANKLATPIDQGYYLDLYAIWVPEYVWVHYDVNGGESSLASARHIKGDTIALPEQGTEDGQVSREGYMLDGWKMKTAAGDSYAGNPSDDNKPYNGTYDLTGDVWFQAQWTVGNYTVNFYRTGNDGNDPAEPATRTYEMDTTYELPLATGTAGEHDALSLTPPTYDLETGSWQTNAQWPASAAATRNVGDKVGITAIDPSTTDETEIKHLKPETESRKAYQITEGETIYKYNLMRSTDQEGTVTYTISLNSSWPGDDALGCTITDVEDTSSPYYFTKNGDNVVDASNNEYAHTDAIADNLNKVAVQHRIYQYNKTVTSTNTVYTLTETSGWADATTEAGYTIAGVSDTNDSHYFTTGAGIIVKDNNGNPSAATNNQVATKTTTDTVYKYSFTKAEESDTYTLTLNEGWEAVAAEGSGYTISDVTDADADHYYPTAGDGVTLMIGEDTVESEQMANYKNQVATKTTTETVYQYDVATSTSTNYAITANPNWPEESDLSRYFVEDVTDTNDPGYVAEGSTATVGEGQQNVDVNKVAYPATTIYEWDLTPDQAPMVFVGWATSAEKAGAGEAAFRNVALTDAFKITNLTKTIGGEVNLYAVWAESIHNYVVYDSNGGTWGTGGQTVASLIDDQTFKTEYTDAVPTRVGYTFDKWATRSGTGEEGDPYEYTPVTADTTFSVGEGTDQTAIDSTVYAQWTPVTYHVVFNGDAYEADGTLVSDPSSATQNMNYDEAANLNPYAWLTVDGVGFASAAHVKSLKGWTTEKPTTALAPGATDTRIIAYQDGQEVINLTSLAYDPVAKYRTETVVDDEGNPEEVQVAYYEGEVNLYPVFEYDYVTVAYDSNGGTSLSAVTALNGDTIRLPKPTRDGYTLMGWVEGVEQGENTELPAAGVAGIAGANYSPTSNVTLHAWWKKAETGHVLYKWMEGEEQMAQYLLDLNAYVVGEDSFVVAFDPSVTRRAGYTFDGWINADNETNPPYVYTEADTEEERTLSFQPSGSTKDMTFLAQWKPITYKVTYDLNNADSELIEGEIPAIDVTYDYIQTTGDKCTPLWNPTTDETDMANAPAHKHFAGWATQATSTVADFPAGEDGAVNLTANLSSTQDAQITLYAVWAADTGTLAFDTNGGTAPKTDSITVTTGQAWPDLPNSYKPTKGGNVFLGYYDSPDEDATQVYDADLICQMPNAIEVSQGQSITLYAHWIVATYTVVYRGLDGTELARQTVPIETDYRLKSNEDNDIDIDIAATQKFQWVVGGLANKGAPAFVQQPGAIIEDGVWKHSSVPPQRGDVIELWADVLDLQRFTVTYDANGGYYVGGAVPSVKYVTEGDPHAVQFTKVPSLKGYRFVGWTLAQEIDGQDTYKKFFTESEYDRHADDEFRVAKEEGDVYSLSFIPTDNSILYAIWEEASYTVAYHGNGGTTDGEPAGDNNVDVIDADVPYSSRISLRSANTFQRDGYAFMGWGLNNTTVRYEAGEYGTGLAEDGQTLDLYAIWVVSERNLKLTSVADQTYTGEPIEPRPNVRLAGEDDLLVRNRDYVLAYENNTEVGEATITATGVGNYAGYTGTTTFQIVEAPEDQSTTFLVGNIEDQTYTGAEIKPEPEVKATEEGSALIKDTDYTLSYDNNVEVGTATVSVTGKGDYENYSGSVTFQIVSSQDKKLDISEIAPQTHTGHAIMPKPAVKDANGKLLVLNYDYVLAYDNNVEVGDEAVVTAVGIGNTYVGYYGTRNFSIVAEPEEQEQQEQSIGITVAPIEDQEYTGAEIKPEPQVTYKQSEAADPVELTKDTDYTLLYDNNIAVGTATVYAIGKGDYAGKSGSASFQIVSSEDKIFTVADVEDQVFTGSAIMPTPEVKAGNTTLTLNTDYVLTYENNVNVSDVDNLALINVTGINEYSGYSASVSFVIMPAEKTFNVSAIPTQTYTSLSVEPTVAVSLASTPLNINRDYVVSYENNVNLTTNDSMAKAIVTGIGEYSGYKGEATFAIEQADISTATLSGIEEEYAVTGSEIKPEPVITMVDGKVTLKSGTDYTLGYENNVELSSGETKATITITGTGNYTGSTTATFRIVPIDISKAKIADIRGRGYDGKPYEPKPKVTLNGKTLVEGTDFEYSYKNNIYASVESNAVLTITGKGNYTGKATKEFMVWKNGQPMTAWAVARSIKVSEVTKSNGTVDSPVHVAHAVSAGSPLEYRKMGGDSRLNVDLYTGKVTVKKGTPVGTYNIKIRVIAFGGHNYADGTVTCDCQIKVVK